MIFEKGWSKETDVFSIGCTIVELYISKQLLYSLNTRDHILKF